MDKVTQEMEAAVCSGVFPGAVLLVTHRGKTIYHMPFGCSAILPEREPVFHDTIFDVASLTKPVVTASLCAMLIKDRLLSLDDKVSELVFFPGKEKITVSHLLSHSSGLPAWRPLYRNVNFEDPPDKRKKAILDFIHNLKPSIAPGVKTIYSDLGFIILGEIIEKLTGHTLDQLTSELIFDRLGMKKSFFLNKNDIPENCFAATSKLDGHDKFKRGMVSDDNCYAMGGVSGHAGLFSTACDLALFANEMVKARNGKSKVLPETQIRLFTQRTGSGSWGLGWDTPSANSSSGSYFTTGESFGHLGFTGVSLWIDAKRQIAVILLTNRVHPVSQNTKIRKFRPVIHDIIIENMEKSL